MIEYKDICLRFNDKTILEDFNLSIGEGEKVLLTAPSGRGKSSLMKMLLGFIRPDSGHIYYNGKLLDKRTIKECRQNINYVSQDVDLYNQPVHLLIKEILNYKVNRHLVYDEQNIMDIFNTFHLHKDLFFKSVEELSGGERQRLGLVLCILLDRPIWLLDEVTSGLDEDMKKLVIDYVINTDKAVMIISHDQLWSEYASIRKVRW